MLRCLLKAKLHQATVTSSDINYEGSITIDTALLELSGIVPYEQVQISNLNNGERFETYVIPGGKGEICLNGPTARKGLVGDTIIIFAYCYLTESEMKGFEPTIIKLGKNNIPLKS